METSNWLELLGFTNRWVGLYIGRLCFQTTKSICVMLVKWCECEANN
jgi:hypothetical protein